MKRRGQPTNESTQAGSAKPKRPRVHLFWVRNRSQVAWPGGKLYDEMVMVTSGISLDEPIDYGPTHGEVFCKWRRDGQPRKPPGSSPKYSARMPMCRRVSFFFP